MVRSTDSLYTLCRQSGDANLGQTLIRLAQLAAAAHRHEVAGAVADEHRGDGDIQIDGQVLGPTVHDPGMEAQRDAPFEPGSVHTEVNR